jgi:small-conductance mechanosensitive channel
MIENLADLWVAVRSAMGAGLFSIGNSVVTTGGILRVLLTIALAAVVSRAVRGALGLMGARWVGSDRSTLYTLNRIIHYVIVAIGVTIGLSTIGLDFTNVAVLLGALGIGIGFGLQDIVANFIAGIMILFERHLRVGDFVELQSGIAGEVREIRMRATRIVTNDSVDILVPNSEFVHGRVLNWTLDDADRRIHVPFGVSYGSDKDLVRQAGLEAAERVTFTLRGVPRRAPQVWLVGFGDSSLNFELVVWVTREGVMRPGASRAAYLWEIHSMLQSRGIEVPFPQRDLHVRSVFGLEGEEARTLLGGDRALTPTKPAGS